MSGPLRKFLAEREPLIPRKKLFDSDLEEDNPESEEDNPIDRSIDQPLSGRTHAAQSDEAYCLECVEGHTMLASTEMRHAIDRYRTANRMTPGVIEKVRVAIAELQGINEDVRNTKGASPEIKQGLDEILDETRWIRKEYGVSGKALTRGYGDLKDLEELRSRILSVQNKAYVLVEKCPTCRKIERAFENVLGRK